MKNGIFLRIVFRDIDRVNFLNCIFSRILINEAIQLNVLKSTKIFLSFIIFIVEKIIFFLYYTIIHIITFLSLNFFKII